MIVSPQVCFSADLYRSNTNAFVIGKNYHPTKQSAAAAIGGTNISPGCIVLSSGNPLTLSDTYLDKSLVKTAMW
jgi:hypothetical protein